MADKLYRSRDDKVIGGVCGGLADYFQVDSTWIRLGFIVVVLAGGAGLLAYILCWIVIPEEPAGRVRRAKREEDVIIVNGPEEEEGGKPDYVPSDKREHSQRQKILGFALVILGFFFLADHLFPFFRWIRFWPMLIIVLGIGLVLKGVQNRG